MQRISQLLLTVLLLLSGSCKIDPPGEIILIPVLENDYRIGMREVIVGEQRELRFSLATSEPRHCQQALVENRFFLQNSVLRIDLMGIAQPVSCTPGVSDAFTLTPSLLLPGNLFEIRIALGEAVVNKGLLRVRPDGYAIEILQRTGITLDSDLLLKLPRELVWGYVNPGDPAAVADIDARVRTDLANLGAIDISLTKGYYGYFRVDNNDAVLIPGAMEEGVTFAYVLPDNDDPASLEALASAWRAEFGPGAEVVLFTTRGDEF